MDAQRASENLGRCVDTQLARTFQEPSVLAGYGLPDPLGCCPSPSASPGSPGRWNSCLLGRMEDLEQKSRLTAPATGCGTWLSHCLLGKLH